MIKVLWATDVVRKATPKKSKKIMLVLGKYYFQLTQKQAMKIAESIMDKVDGAQSLRRSVRRIEKSLPAVPAANSARVSG